MSDDGAVTIRMPRTVDRLLVLAGAVVGVGVGFAAAPLLRMLLATIDAAPGPLRLLAALPTPWAVGVSTLLGAAVGCYLVWRARLEGVEVTVRRTSVVIVDGGAVERVGAADVTEAVVEGKYLVLRGAHEELARAKTSDLPQAQLREAFTAHGYRWNTG